MTQPRISALDLATVSGLAYGQLGEIPRFETWKLKDGGQSIGGRGLMLMTRLLAHLKNYEPELVAIEMPLHPAILVSLRNNAESARFLPGVVFLAETVCHSRGVETILYDRQKVLMHFTGRARYPGKNDDAKKACMARCWQLGWKPEDVDQADAGALLDYAASIKNPRSFVHLAAERPIARTS